jgi:hypothetical protein
MVAFALFDRVEVGSLKVFDERQRENGLVIDLFDDRRDFLPSEPGRGAEATLACDQFESVFSWPASYSYRLKQTTRSQTFLKLSHLLGVEFSPGLKWVSANLSDRDRF